MVDQIYITLQHGEDRWELYVNGDYVGSDDQLDVEDILHIAQGKLVVLTERDETNAD